MSDADGMSLYSALVDMVMAKTFSDKEIFERIARSGTRSVMQMF
jgi:hypothetical protein